MLIPAHIGFTLLASDIVRRLGKKSPFPLKTVLLIGFCALLPDIFDKSLHLFFPRYPTHALFHSLVLLSLLFVMSLLFKYRNLTVLFAIMTFNSLLDLVNTAPGALIYPLRGWYDRAHFYGPVGRKLLERLPEMFSVKGPFGHYVVFEVVGLLCIVWVIIGNRPIKKNTNLIPTHHSPYKVKVLM